MMKGMAASLKLIPIADEAGPVAPETLAAGTVLMAELALIVKLAMIAKLAMITKLALKSPEILLKLQKAVMMMLILQRQKQ